MKKHMIKLLFILVSASYMPSIANAQYLVYDPWVLGAVGTNTKAIVAASKFNTTSLTLINTTLVTQLQSINAAVNAVKAQVKVNSDASTVARRTTSKALREQINDNKISERNSSLSYYTKLGSAQGGSRADDVQKQGCQSNRVERALIRATDYARGAARMMVSNIMAGGTNSKLSKSAKAKKALFEDKFCTQSEIDAGLCIGVTPCTPAQENSGACLAGGDHDASVVMSSNLNTSLKQDSIKRFIDNLIFPVREGMTYNNTPTGVSRYLEKQSKKSTAALGLSSVLVTNLPISSALQTNMIAGAVNADKESKEWITSKTANGGVISIDDLLKYDIVSRYGNTMYASRLKGKGISVKLTEIALSLASMHNLAYENYQLMRQLLLVQSTALADQINRKDK